MIDRERVTVMTKAAMDESHNRRKIFPAMNFYADDYVSFQVLKGILAVTLFYILAVACWALYTADTWMLYSVDEALSLLVRLGLLYLCVLVVSVIILILVYALRYTQSRRVVKEQQRDLKKISHFYENQERQRGE